MQLRFDAPINVFLLVFILPIYFAFVLPRSAVREITYCYVLSLPVYILDVKFEL